MRTSPTSSGHACSRARRRATWSELARTLGYANAPRALLVIGVIAPIAGVVALIVGIWVLVATIVAIRAALDYATGRAIATAVIGWLVQAIVIGLLWGLAIAS